MRPDPSRSRTQPYQPPGSSSASRSALPRRNETQPAQRGQPVERLGRERAGDDVPQDDDPVRLRQPRVGEHGVERVEVPVDVGQGGGRHRRGERTLHSLLRRFDVVFGVRAALLVAAGFLTLAGAAPAGSRAGRGRRGRLGRDAPVPGLVPGWNAVDGSSDTRDTGGHGTGVAIVAAATCGGCRILPVRITDDSGSSTQGLIASGIRWAAGHGARVINLSWGLAIGAPLDRPGGAGDRLGRRPGRRGDGGGDERRLARPEPEPVGESESRRGARGGGR